MFCARRDVGAVNYGFRECLVVCLDPNTRARHRILGADNAMELAPLERGGDFPSTYNSFIGYTRRRDLGTNDHSHHTSTTPGDLSSVRSQIYMLSLSPCPGWLFLPRDFLSR